MRCNGCGDENLVLDESSGRYVCTSCWQVTEYFEGLTQETNELVNLRGLRMVHQASSVSVVPSASQFSYQEVVTKPEPLFQESQLHLKIESPPTSPHSFLNIPQSDDANLAKHEDLKEENADGEHVSAKRPKPSKRKESKRSWRLSEPFTALLRIQLNEIIRTYFRKVKEEEERDQAAELLRETAWCLWTNYLAITGELGAKAWALAFRQVSAAGCQLLHSRESFISSASVSSSKSSRSKEPQPPKSKKQAYPQPISPDLTMIMVNSAWLNMQFHTKSFHWAGWGQIYNPTEAAGLTFHLFGPEPESQPGLDENSFSSDEDCKEEKSPVKSKPVTPARHSVNGRLDPPIPVDELLSLCSIDTDLASLQQYWAELVVDKMSKKSLGEEVFWRGQVDHIGDRLLMECNLSLLFLASLLAFSKPPPPTANLDPDSPLQPTCKRGLLTLRDLHCICAEKRFPFLAIDNFLEGFPIFDQGLDVLFQRRRLPSAECLARVTVVLIHMLGIYHRPRLPLCHLVHRFLNELGLPVAVHEMANSLISRLGRAVELAAHNSRQGLHYFLPLKRYVRGEVFAMAVIVVLVRMLFKLDDCYEYRWSAVAEFLADHPAKRSLLYNLLRRTTSQRPDFLWTRWVKWAEDRHSARLQPRMTARTTGDPINRPVSFADLLLLQDAGEFLGSSEFLSGFDVGWGETQASNASVAANEIKSSMSAPLRAIFSKSNEERNHETDESDCRTSEQCSTCCRLELASALRPFYSRGAPCTEEQCDLLIGVRRLILSQGLTPKVFLQTLFDEPSDAARAPTTARKDWLYILKKFTLYAPISTLDFQLRGKSGMQLCQVHLLPTVVRDFHREHSAGVECFLAESGTSHPSADWNCALSSEDEQQQQEKGKQQRRMPSASLRWFLDIACSLCSSDLAGLLKEVRCIEILLDLLPPAAAPTGRVVKSVLMNPMARDRADLALAVSFDYSLC
ncbi:hypothetical protein SprV_0702433500 [Sparganum proliferum]